MNSKPQKHILLVDDDESIRCVIEAALEDHDFSVHACADAETAWQAFTARRPDVVISDIRMPGTDGLSFIQKIKEKDSDLPVILITAHSDLETTLAAFDAGAFDYLPKPFDLEELIALVERALISDETTTMTNSETSTRLIGRSPAMQNIFRAIGRLSRSEVTVLITGESGSGKEMVARAIHHSSPRRHAPFVAVNMAAIPAELIEAELFGHEKGAFTGANERRLGLFESATGGTLFLDEIGDMPISAQTRLLRVLQEGQFYRVGGRHPVTADVRIIAATHRDLTSRVQQGAFREDLYHRLNVVQLALPPLRERTDDIPELVEYFLEAAAKETGMPKKRIDASAMARLQQFPWPGNVRQLQNLCRWLTVMVSGRLIQLSDLPAEYQNTVASAEVDWQTALRAEIRRLLKQSDRDAIRKLLPSIEHLLLSEVLAFTNGHRQQTAEWLGWGRNTVTRKLKHHPSGGHK
ncbi:MAG: nitrogen regulation protein NR(I) [Gammaproteobacteria bacterium]|nr:MAG: nitrogen regulation protein NR(I) [Gammaproteobacteria bacterium]